MVLDIVPYAGEYLALTGEKINGAEMMACGLATHYSLKEVSIHLFSIFNFTRENLS